MEDYRSFTYALLDKPIPLEKSLHTIDRGEHYPIVAAQFFKRSIQSCVLVNLTDFNNWKEDRLKANIAESISK